MRQKIVILMSALWMTLFMLIPNVATAKSMESKSRFLILELRGDPDLHRVSKSSFHQALSKILRKKNSLLSDQEAEDAYKVLEKIIHEENQNAQEAYDAMRFEEVEDVLQGREDEQALKRLALNAFTQGDEKQASRYLHKLMSKNPTLLSSEKEFPPRFLKFLSKIQSSYEKREKKSSVTRPIDVKSFTAVSGVSFGEWNKRLLKWMEEAHFDGVVAYEMSPIGWNTQVTLYAAQKFHKTNQDSSVVIQVVNGEVLDPKDMSEAAQVLIEKLFGVDSKSKNL